MNAQPRDDFFIAGGTLRPRASSYIKRSADDQLYNHILKGEFCYVLTPRQMGKSSLMVRTALRLQENGFATATIDLTKIGTTDIGRWYLGILTQIEKDLKLGTNPSKWWKDHEHLSAVQRFIDFLRESVLTKTDRKIAIFIDEIDSTLKYDFRDDFFAGIRSLYNARAEDRQYERLTFVLLGVAAPTDLINDRARTPFNIGQEISLTNFSRKEVSAFGPTLEQNFPGHGADILNKIYDWSSGHPYLTQKLCMAIAEQKLPLNKVQLDDFIKRLFLSQEEYRETNLQFVRDMLTKSPQKRQLVSLYARIRKGEKVAEDKKSPIQNQLRLSGLVRSQAGCLVVNNKIYHEAFNLEWIKENTDVNWTRIIAYSAGPIALFFFIAFLYNSLFIPSQMARANDCFYNPQNSPEKRLSCLATMFRRDPFFSRGNNDDQAREKYFSLPSWEEQNLIFQTEQMKSQDLIDVIRGLYYGMGTVNPRENTPLLETMKRALGRVERTQETDQLERELDAWLTARRSLEIDDASALAGYNKAIEINSENPSTLFERGILFLGMDNYTDALRNFDETIRVSKKSAPAEQPTELPTEQLTELPTEPELTATVVQSTESQVSSTPQPTSTPEGLIPPESTFVPQSITSEFYTHTKRVIVIRSIIADFLELRSALRSSGSDEYINLKAAPEIASLLVLPAQRITIPAGQTSFTFAGVINPSQSVSYIIAASQGQMLSISLTGPANTEVTLGVNGPTGLALKSPDGNFTWSTSVATGGDHTIMITSLPGAAAKAYALTVSLTSSVPSATPTPEAVFSGSFAQGESTVIHPDLACNWAGIGGTVVDANNSPVVGTVVVLRGTLNGSTIEQQTVSGINTEYGPSGFEFVLNNAPIESNNTLFVQLMDQQNIPLSDSVPITTIADCSKNLVIVRFKRNK